MSLYERYFPVKDEEETQRVRSEERALVSEIQHLAGSPGWPILKEHVAKLLKRFEPVLGTEQEMATRIAARMGVLYFSDLLDRIEAEARSGGRS